MITKMGILAEKTEQSTNNAAPNILLYQPSAGKAALVKLMMIGRAGGSAQQFSLTHDLGFGIIDISKFISWSVSVSANNYIWSRPTIDSSNMFITSASAPDGLTVNTMSTQGATQLFMKSTDKLYYATTSQGSGAVPYEFLKVQVLGFEFDEVDTNGCRAGVLGQVIPTLSGLNTLYTCPFNKTATVGFYGFAFAAASGLFELIVNGIVVGAQTTLFCNTTQLSTRILNGTSWISHTLLKWKLSPGDSLAVNVSGDYVASLPRYRAVGFEHPV